MKKGSWKKIAVIDSEAIRQKVACYTDGKGRVMAKCADGTVYTDREIALASIFRVVWPAEVHVLKREFGGEVATIEPSGMEKWPGGGAAGNACGQLFPEQGSGA